MESYMKLLDEVLSRGTPKSDRTGTGTTSVFGAQFHHDLSTGFPILTTKKVHWKSVLGELLWFVSGNTNVKWLQDNGITIWNEWSDENGDLGPVYGWNWRRWGEQYVPRPRLADGVPATYLGVGNGKGKHNHPLGKTWEGMMARCYDTNSPSYPNYGGAGVQVCSRWLQFENFAADAVNLPGYRDGRRAEGGERLVLDKDQRGRGKLYSPESCMWLTDKENINLNHHRTFIVENENGDQFSFRSATEFGDRMGFDPKNLSDLWTGNKNAAWRNGYRLVSIQDDGGTIDQLQNVIDTIRTDPDSRRLIVSAWNPEDINDMALPPCHMMFQFYVNNGKLSCHMYQRSADLFLGVPFNIASYAALTHMVAHVCGLDVGTLTISFGDLHLYNNHKDQMARQVIREPYPLPTLRITKDTDNIDEFTMDDFVLENYQYHPGIKGQVAV